MKFALRIDVFDCLGGLMVGIAMWNLDYAFMCSPHPEYLNPLGNWIINFGVWINIQYFWIILGLCIMRFIEAVTTE